MKKGKISRTVSLLLIASMLFCLTGCGETKFVNTKYSNSYIKLNSGWNESSGSGRANNVTYWDGLGLSGNFTYSSGSAYIQTASGRYSVAKSELSVSSSQIKVWGYTYKKS